MSINGAFLSLNSEIMFTEECVHGVLNVLFGNKHDNVGALDIHFSSVKYSWRYNKAFAYISLGVDLCDLYSGGHEPC
jgi:hypothetical protein